MAIRVGNVKSLSLKPDLHVTVNHPEHVLGWCYFTIQSLAKVSKHSAGNSRRASTQAQLLLWCADVEDRADT